jgi:hypothetical protein
VLARLRGDDEGAAMVIVVGSMLVLAMLALTALTYSLSGQRFARYDQDYAAAMSAAQSGVDEFISRMDSKDGYGIDVDCANPAWRGPMASSSNTCGWNNATAAGWAPVEAGATGPRDAAFHYAVDASKRITQGTVVLVATGRVNGVFRTVEATIGMGGSTDYVYYTDFESADPSNVQAYAQTASSPSVICGRNGTTSARYWYTGRSSANPACKEIQFISTDTLNGAVFSNDTIYSTGATFQQSFETADPKCQNATASSSTWASQCLRAGSSATFGVQPRYSSPKYLPDNSSAFATNPGCHYYGATRVVFQADGSMRVWNRKSVNGNRAPVAIDAPDGTRPTCGSLDALDSGAGALVPVPDEMVIYASGSGTANRQCFGGEIGGPSGKQLPIGSYTGAAATNTGQSYTYDTNMAETTKFCGQGNLYAEGILNGRVTISAEQSVIATGDLVLAGGQVATSDDMLGLVATNSVEVFHPRQVTVSSTRTCVSWDRWGNCNGNSYGWGSPSGESEVSGWPVRYRSPGESANVPSDGILVAGSIQTLQHSFLVQKYNVGGSAGQLRVWGSIAQRWRGIVGENNNTGMNGYSKLYQYDSRLVFSRPPYFPTWANAQWSLRYSGEINTPANVRG